MLSSPFVTQCMRKLMQKPVHFFFASHCQMPLIRIVVTKNSAGNFANSFCSHQTVTRASSDVLDSYRRLMQHKIIVHEFLHVFCMGKHFCTCFCMCFCSMQLIIGYITTMFQLPLSAISKKMSLYCPSRAYTALQILALTSCDCAQQTVLSDTASELRLA